MSILFCDGDCELWWERQEALEIHNIEMPYTVDGTEYYYDLGKNTDFEAFFEKMRGGSKVITSALNVQNYVDYFEPIFALGEDILYVHFSSKLSATFTQMDAAIKELKEKYPARTIRTFDTRSISIGSAELVYAAALMHREGVPDEEIVARLEALRKRLCVVFTPETLTYLARGGRLSKGKALMGNIFNLKPMLSIEPEGSLVNYAKVNGRKKAIRHMFEKVGEHGLDLTRPVIVTHASCEADAMFLRDLIAESYPAAEVWVQPVGPVIGCHCGPGTLGLTFFTKKDLY